MLYSSTYYTDTDTDFLCCSLSAYVCTMYYDKAPVKKRFLLGEPATF